VDALKKMIAGHIVEKKEGRAIVEIETMAWMQ
jgi:hypothetical protein